MNAQHRCTRVINVTSRADQVPLARREIVNTLQAWGVPDDDEAVYAVRLIASELLTNVVRHASTVTAEISIVVELIDGVWMRMGVHDSHPHCPSPAHNDPAHNDAEAVNGRGLKIVHELVGEFKGVILIERTDDGGKTIWIELPCATSPCIAPPRATDGHVTEAKPQMDPAQGAGRRPPRILVCDRLRHHH